MASPYLRAAAPQGLQRRIWIIWIAPFGRTAKHSSALLRLLAKGLRLLAMASHYLQASPNGQTLRNSLITQTYIEGALLHIKVAEGVVLRQHLIGAVEALK